MALPGTHTAGQMGPLAPGRSREAYLRALRQGFLPRIGSRLDPCIVRTEICIVVRSRPPLDLNDQLLADAEALAAQQRTSLTRLIEEGLQLRLRAKPDFGRRRPVRLPVFKGRGGLVAGLNPLSNKALLGALGDDA